MYTLTKREGGHCRSFHGTEDYQSVCQFQREAPQAQPTVAFTEPDSVKLCFSGICYNVAQDLYVEGVKNRSSTISVTRAELGVAPNRALIKACLMSKTSIVLPAIDSRIISMLPV